MLERSFMKHPGVYDTCALNKALSITVKQLSSLRTSYVPQTFNEVIIDNCLLLGFFSERVNGALPDVAYLGVSFICDVSAFINRIIVWQKPPALHFCLTSPSLTHSLLYLTIGILQLTAICISCSCNDPSKEILALLGQGACSIPLYKAQCGAHGNESSSAE